ncbi:hypothetical protein [Nocardioides sp. Leaf285]|uniref:hypothetical protein n=1 Tax=Nocardioides sp. Leaf285 TaxID=1736322 RepID=UPI0007030C4E|nr:hypothetical protein [Nocardioides sp. Leaf285]KQP65673.1 hypothetical protein ASF47_07960 [Nocardioides sp. Leaf285]
MNAVLILLVTWIPLSLPLGMVVAAILRGALSAVPQRRAHQPLSLVSRPSDTEAPLADVA